MAAKYFNYPPSISSDGANVRNGGKHYMMINSYESKSAISTNEDSMLSSIGLYIPPAALTTKFTGDYSSKDGAATTAAMGEIGLSFGQIGKALRAVGEKTTTAIVGGLDKGGFMSEMGKAPNNHMALLFKGPGSFRDHSFAFKFFPKNKPESDLVKDIISDFKNGMLPTMGFGDGSVLNSSFFKAPRHHKIKFFNGAGENPYLFEIGTSVITDMSVNYDPQSLVGFHSDGSPVQIDMSLTFKEIELQVSKDKLTGPARTQMAASEFQTQMARATDVTRNSSGSRQNRERDF